MRIGFVITSLHGGGAEFVVRQWAEELSGNKHEIEIYTYKQQDLCFPLPRGVKHHHFSADSRFGRVLGLPVWLRYRAHRDDLDVLVTMMTFANLAALVGLRSLCGSRVPVVISERNTMTVKQALEGGNRTKRWLAQRLYRRADAVVAISHPVAADLAGACRIDMKRTFIVPNPVVRVPAQSFERENPNSLHILFVGRLVPAKNPRLFVDTILELTHRGILVRGTVIGDGSLRSSFEEYATERQVQLDFLGWREPWWDAVEGVDCLLLPSTEEGFGNVLVEAAAARIPCVARSAALGVADAIVPGVTGEFANGGRPQDLSEAILRAVRHGGADRDPIRSWLAHFSASHSAAMLISVLERVVDSDSTGF